MIKKLGMAGLSLMHKEHTLYYEWLRRSTGNRPIFWGGAEAFMETGKKRILSHRLKQKFNGVTSWQAIEPIYQRFLNKAKDPSHLNWMSYVDLNFRLPELLLMRVDKMSMGVSLEARVPFLDHKFVELAMSIPEHIKTRNGVSKYILKKAVRGLIPDEIIDRKKQGFGVPVYEWFYDKLGDKMKKDILDFCDATDYFDKKAVKSLLMAGTQTSNIWYLLNFVLWHKEYIE
jgi:asparagine synthase (glutamine-hydrolysing)